MPLDKKVVETQGSDQFMAALNEMETMGGGFVKALAAAWHKADSFNHSKLVAAFPEYLHEYAERAERASKKYAVVEAGGLHGECVAESFVEGTEQGVSYREADDLAHKCNRDNFGARSYLVVALPYELKKGLER
jgi:hypothetical protein